MGQSQAGLSRFIHDIKEINYQADSCDANFVYNEKYYYFPEILHAVRFRTDKDVERQSTLGMAQIPKDVQPMHTTYIV